MLGLHRARIETIHAFALTSCASADRGRARPQLRGAAGARRGLAFDEAYDDWVHELFAAGSPHEDLLRRLLNRGFDLRQMREVVDEVQRRRHALPLRAFPRAMRPDLEQYVREVERLCEELARVEAACKDGEDRGLPQIEAIREYRDELRAAAGDRRRSSWWCWSGCRRCGRAPGGRTASTTPPTAR